MSDPIIFYDIPGNSPECKAWSPNTWKVRFALNYKSIAYKTEWVEYPDIGQVYTKHGIQPIVKGEDGKLVPTLPVIHDPSTGKTITDSWKIVKYLDVQYPETPTLFPKGTDMLHESFRYTWGTQVQSPLWDIVAGFVWNRLNERSQVYYRTTREASEGRKLEEFAGRAEWKAAEAGFAKLDVMYKKNGEGRDDWVMGSEDSPCFGDLMVVSGLMWAMTAHGRDSPEWARIASWNDGKWGRLVKRWEKYAIVDQ